MKAWWWAHRKALFSGLRNLLRQPFALLLTLSMIGVALALPTLLWVMLSNGERVVARLPVQPQLTLFLKPEVSADTARQLQKQIEASSGVKVQWIGREAAFKDLIGRANLAELGDALPDNPLPDALVLQFADPAAPAQQQAQWAARPEVAEVVHDAAWVERLVAITQLGRSLIGWLSALLAIGLLVVMGNTVRLQILLRRDEIEVSRLIGATRAFIRRPFLYFAGLQGMLGGATAWGITALATWQLSAPVLHLARLYGTELTLAYLPWWQGLLLMAAAGVLAWLGAWVAVTRHLLQLDHR
ncbi:permease-like cell division protein FtsX [Leeia aquatica]|uniref:Cell division protein FtsX n=1 Tax=Leeia aquatica TaxID=2725557 RepID=A0A847SFD1_9NEIS|nr:permease-like cell division protein FtsX [Leeia aquatica]NLR76136.1 ABC transporter permease [Leeia aquatica]